MAGAAPRRRATDRAAVAGNRGGVREAGRGRRANRRGPGRASAGQQHRRRVGRRLGPQGVRRQHAGHPLQTVDRHEIAAAVRPVVRQTGRCQRRRRRRIPVESYGPKLPELTDVF